jgi:hypothetical protein
MFTKRMNFGIGRPSSRSRRRRSEWRKPRSTRPPRRLKPTSRKGEPKSLRRQVSFAASSGPNTFAAYCVSTAITDFKRGRRGSAHIVLPYMISRPVREQFTFTEFYMGALIPAWIIGGPLVGFIVLSMMFKGPSSMVGSGRRDGGLREEARDRSAPLFDPMHSESRRRT